MRDFNTSDARRQLVHLLGYLSDATISDYDGSSESAYAVLYSLGLDQTPQMRVGEILRNAWEASAIETLAVGLDEVLAAYGNCETETNNLKAAAWARVQTSAQEAYSLLTTEYDDID